MNKTFNKIARLVRNSRSDAYFGFLTTRNGMEDRIPLLESQSVNNVSECKVEEFEQRFALLVGDGDYISFASGRMGFYAVMRILNITEGDDVVLTGSTCSVMVNAVLRIGARPIYADIDPTTLGSCPEKIKHCITAKTKLVVAQHSFGIPCRISEIAGMCRNQNIFLLEDCALAVGSKVRGRSVGTFGDAALFSTDHTKPINTFTGGGIYTENAEISQMLREVQAESQSLSLEKQSVMYHQVRYENTHCLPGDYGRFCLTEVVRSRFAAYVGRRVSPFLDDDSTANPNSEYPYPAKMPPFLAQLGIHELDCWSEVSKKRHERLERYLQLFSGAALKERLPMAYFDPELYIVPLRFVWADPDAHSRTKKLSRYLHTEGFWFRTPIVATHESLANFFYAPGCCPVSEKIGKQIINLPVALTDSDFDCFYSMVGNGLRP